MESTEMWRPIPGYEGHYEVSNHGRVRSIDYIDPRGVFWRGRILKQAVQKIGGYPYVGLRKDGKVHTKRVHALVALAFIGPRPERMEVCHGNGNPADNRLSNLRYDTRSANSIDRTRHGRNKDAIKTHCPRGHRYVEPNLQPADLRVGRRSCRACNRELNRVRVHGGEFSIERANEQYRRIMNAE